LLEERGWEWILKSANATTGLSWEGNVLVHKGSTTTSATVEDLLDDTRDERFRQVTEGSPR